MHKDFATVYFPTFAKAFTPAFLEGEKAQMRLEDVSADMFGKLLHWLYTKQIEDQYEVNAASLAKLWSLAQRFCVTELQNHTMINILQLVRHQKGSDLQKLVEYTYKTKEETPLKKLVVDKVA